MQRVNWWWSSVAFIPIQSVSQEPAPYAQRKKEASPHYCLLVSTSTLEAGEKLDTVADVLSVDTDPNLDSTAARTAVIKVTQQEEVEGVNPGEAGKRAFPSESRKLRISGCPMEIHNFKSVSCKHDCLLLCYLMDCSNDFKWGQNPLRLHCPPN